MRLRFEGTDSALVISIEPEIHMGRTSPSARSRAQALPKPKIKTQSEIEQLREENRQLRELVAHLAKLVLDRIADTAKPESTRVEK